MKHSLILLTLIFLSFLGKSQSKNFIDQPYIEVNGTADSLVTPNEIFIKIIISENDNKGKVSVEELESKMIEAFGKIGIHTETDLTIDDISSNFKFYLLKRTDVFKTKEYNLKVSDAKMAGKVFIELQNLNISNASIQRIGHSNLDEINNLVRSKAVENAKTRAIALTKPLNQNIGLAMHIFENGEANNFLQGKVAGVSIRGNANYKEEEYLSNIEFEKIRVSSSVNVVFILK